MNKTYTSFRIKKKKKNRENLNSQILYSIHTHKNNNLYNIQTVLNN